MSGTTYTIVSILIALGGLSMAWRGVRRLRAGRGRWHRLAGYGGLLAGMGFLTLGYAFFARMRLGVAPETLLGAVALIVGMVLRTIGDIGIVREHRRQRDS